MQILRRIRKRPSFLFGFQKQLKERLLVGQDVQLVLVVELFAEEPRDGLVKGSAAHRAVGVGEDRELALVKAAGGHLGAGETWNAERFRPH